MSNYCKLNVHKQLHVLYFIFVNTEKKVVTDECFSGYYVTRKKYMLQAGRLIFIPIFSSIISTYATSIFLTLQRD